MYEGSLLGLLVVSVLFWMVGAMVGAALGEIRGRVALGTLLGCLLGPVGWVIVLTMRTRSERWPASDPSPTPPLPDPS
jgi:uncharacterized membrane protein YfcA